MSLDLPDSDLFSSTLLTFPVITAGSAQKPGESRLDLAKRNLSILQSIIRDLSPVNPDAIVLMVANPVDVLTRYAQDHLGLPPSQVFGSGTYLDTLRLREAIAAKLNIAGVSVHALVLGEHGDSQVAVFSR